jgi:bifunctional DNase/RNase
VIRLSLIGVRVEVPTNQPIVLLREDEGTRFLPIFIGSPEATAIVYALQGMETPRPMTHDLFKTVLDDLSVKLDRVEITELHDGTFYAEIELDRDGAKSRISSRPSDAIALAVRFGGRSRSSPTRPCSTRPACSSRPTTKSTKSSSSASSSTRSPPKTSRSN